MKREKYTLKDGRELIVPYNRYDVAPVTRDLLEKFIAEFDKAHEQAQQLQTIIENLEEIKAKERCRAIDDFAEMLNSRIDANMKQVLKHGLDLDMANLDKSDIDEVAKDIKGVNE